MATMAERRRVFVLDAYPVEQLGLEGFLEREADLEVCGAARSAEQAMAAVAARRPDLVIVCLSHGGAESFHVVAALTARHPGLPVLVLGTDDARLYAERALQAGARGYIMKEEAPKEVVAAVRKVLDGGIYLSERMLGRMVQQSIASRAGPRGSHPLDRLTGRELEVFRLIGRGLTTRQIAEMLALGVKTVETHRAHIKRKLHLADGVELLQCALLWEGSAGTTGAGADAGSA